MAFVQELVARLNESSQARLAEDLPRLKALPAIRLPGYTKYNSVVRKWSTIHFSRRTYSVPSRLIGCEVEVRQHSDLVEVYYRKKLASTPLNAGDIRAAVLGKPRLRRQYEAWRRRGARS